MLVAEQRRDGASAVGSRVIRDGEDLGLDVGDAGDVDRPRRRLVSFLAPLVFRLALVPKVNLKKNMKNKI